MAKNIKRDGDFLLGYEDGRYVNIASINDKKRLINPSWGYYPKNPFSKKAMNYAKKIGYSYESEGTIYVEKTSIDSNKTPKKKIVSREREIEFTQINNDGMGNPRHVVHFLELDDNYNRAIRKSKAFGGRRYNTKGYGGGIVFSSYNLQKVRELIKELKDEDGIGVEMHMGERKPNRTGKGKRKPNGYFQALGQARTSNAKSFTYNGNKYVRREVKAKTSNTVLVYYKKVDFSGAFGGFFN